MEAWFLMQAGDSRSPILMLARSSIHVSTWYVFIWNDTVIATAILIDGLDSSGVSNGMFFF